jgi:transcription initiation factor TFIIE subunit alpha
MPSKKQISLKEILKKAISETAGENSSALIEILFNKKNVNEFSLSKKLNMTINQTRNILYKLNEEGLVSFLRKKDEKKGGWYTYFWTLNMNRALQLLKDSIINRLEKVEQEIVKRQKDRFYYCEGIEVEYSEEDALEHGFVCPETGNVLQLKDNTDIITNLQKESEFLRKELEKAEIELGLIHQKDKKLREKILQEEADKKKELRDERKKERDKEKKKLLKLSGKKVEKKKPKKSSKKKPTKKVSKKKKSK